MDIPSNAEPKTGPTAHPIAYAAFHNPDRVDCCIVFDGSIPTARSVYLSDGKEENQQYKNKTGKGEGEEVSN